MADTAIAARPGLLGRLRMTLDTWARQLLAPIEVPFAGAGTQPDVAQPFPPRIALSVLAAFPWPRACIRARCDDVGGLPLIALRGGRLAEPFEESAFLRLARQPSPGITWTRLMRQWEADFSATGNGFIWLRETIDGFELHRLHPQHVTADVRKGVQVGWKYGGKRLSLAEVWHVADVNWSDDIGGMLFGEASIRCLKDGLQAVQSARQHATKAASKGRPDVAITFPKDSGLGPSGAKDVAAGYEEGRLKGESAFVAGGGLTVTPLTWAPKDLEFQDLDTRVRDETLAVLRVPPTRAGVPQANFAVAKAELRDYWSGLTSADLQLFADAFTQIAHAVGDPPDVAVRFDTSAVEALQTSYDQRQARAGFWVTVMGADPASAAAYEGFRGAPTGDVSTAGTQKASRPAVAVEDQPSRQAAMLERALAAWLATAADRLQGGGADREAETYRLAGVLELAHLTPGEAMDLASEVSAIVCETAETTDRDLSELYAFSAEYARTVARRPRLALAAK